MKRFNYALAAMAAAASSVPLAPESALAHGFAGDRFFPATIVVDDPAVADELSLPTVSKFKNGDNVNETDISAEFSKRITEQFGVSFGENWTHLHPGASGFQNLETTFKFQAVTNATHEFMLSVGLSVEWANTGAKGVGADNFNSYSPQIYFGKGFGDLPEEMGLLRPFAITGQVGYEIPGRAKTTNITIDPNTMDADIDVERNARNLTWGLTLQYSLPYLNSHVKAIEGEYAGFFSRLIPIVEASFSTPVSNFTGSPVTTGTINPGVIWAGDKMQFGVEAILPVNRESGRGAGAIGQVHFYLDDIFPNSIGKPLLEETRS